MSADVKSRAERLLAARYSWHNSKKVVAALLAEVDALTRQRDELLKEKHDTRVGGSSQFEGQRATASTD